MKDLDHMIFNAFRYALGRCTYIVPITTNFIMTNIDIIGEGWIHLMIKEITEAEDRNMLGHDIDKIEWLKLRDFLKGKITTKNI